MIEHQLGSRLGELSLGLIEQRLKRRRINREKDIALFHVGPILKIPRDDLPAHLGLHLDGFKRGARSNLIEIKGDILLDYLCHIHRSRRGGRRGFLPPGNGPKQQEQDDKGNDSSKNVDAFAAETVFEMPHRFARRDIDSGHGCHR